MNLYFNRILTDPKSLIYFDSEVIIKDHRDLALSMSFLYPCYWFFRKSSFFILFINFVSCVFFYEEPLENLRLKPNSEFKEFLWKILFGSKLVLFLFAVGWFIFMFKFGAFGLDAEDAVKNRKENFGLQVVIMVGLFLGFILFLYLLPDAESYFKTHNIK